MISKRFFRWIEHYYHSQLTSLYRSIIPHQATSRTITPHDEVIVRTADEKYDYITISPLILQQPDIQLFLSTVHRFCHENSRILIVTHSPLWKPLFWCAETIGLRSKPPIQHWISQKNMINLACLADFQTIAMGRYLLLPVPIPILAPFCNRILANIPGINRLCLTQWIIAKPQPESVHHNDYTVSVIVPCKNEAGNIIPAIERIPDMGIATEIIFVEGNSRDATGTIIEQAIKQFPEKKIAQYKQHGVGKGDAVRKGFAHATGDILMILDADLTVPPEELPKFFNALTQKKADFINGSRLVYGMESHAMQRLNFIANVFFARLFSWILNSPITDTLCGTKVLWKKDYERLAVNRSHFGDFDPFGDFDLLFGAAKLQLTIINVPVHYKNRTYGSTQIRRFYHGIMLLWMSMIGIRKFKFR